MGSFVTFVSRFMSSICYGVFVWLSSQGAGRREFVSSLSASGKVNEIRPRVMHSCLPTAGPRGHR